MRFEHLPLERGVTHYRAFDIAQDSIGFLWFATAEGLYRYDGTGYRAFRPILNDTAGLSSNTIWCLTTGKDGTLWIGTFDGGLDSFDPRTERFAHFKSRAADSASISQGAITALFEDHMGTLWVGTESTGLNMLRDDRNGFLHFHHEPRNPNSLPSNTIHAICEDRTGTVWVGTDNGICTFDRAKKSFVRPGGFGASQSMIARGNISCLWSDGSGHLWIGMKERGLARYDEGSGRVAWYRRARGDNRSLSCDSVTSIFGNDGHSLWVGTQDGLNKLDEATGACTRYMNEPLNQNSLSSSFIVRVTGDRSGTIWVATDPGGGGSERGGVNKIMRKSEQFVYYQLPLDRDETVGVMALERDPLSDAIWLGTDRGLRRFDPVSGSSSEYRHGSGGGHMLSNNLVSAICTDRSGTLWVGTWGGGLNRFTMADGRFTSYLWNPRHTDWTNAVISLSADSSSGVDSQSAGPSLWVGAFKDGVLHFFPRSGTFDHYKNDPADPRSLSNDRVMVTCVDRNGTLWVGTDGGGLNEFDARTRTFRRFLHDDDDPRSLRSNRVFAICDDPGSTGNGERLLWLGTATGLDRFDAATGMATHIALRDTLSSIWITAMEGSRGHLWISTVRDGIFEVSPNTGAWKNYTAEDGLHSDLFTRASCRGEGGEIYFGGEGGYTVFHPDSIRDNLLAPPVVITTFTVFEKPFDVGGPLWSQSQIHLNYDQDFFSFQFVALDFTAPNRNQFAYKLEGFDGDWNYAGARNFAGYTKVDPGDYVFRVKASNSDGHWNDTGAAVRLTIDPPYWRTWWFKAAVAILVVALLAGAYNYRVSKLLEVQRMRMRIASDLHDDIGSSLSGIALLTESMKSRPQLEDQDRMRLADATDAARRTADSLRDIVWIVNPEHDKVEDIVLRLKDAAAKLLVGLEYSVTCGKHSISDTLSMEFRRHLILIFKEILNNIVKHAHATKVDISIAEEAGVFTLKVLDNGVGFAEAEVKRGNGLNNLQRRAGQIGGKIRLESAPGRGTAVEFSAPLS